jgi:diacylglycerol kinase (ATP)
MMCNVPNGGNRCRREKQDSSRSATTSRWRRGSKRRRDRRFHRLQRRLPMGETVIIYNPQSGSGSHDDRVSARSDLCGYAIERSERAGEAVTLTQDAIGAGYSTIVAGGGDGTVREVVQGIDRADAFDDVTFGILPLGTGNNFAKQIGITDLEAGFAALEDGDRRTVDVGMVSGRPFVNSCVAGITATSVSETSGESKSRIGGLAYVVSTLRTVTEFEPLQLTIEDGKNDGDTPTWSGEALIVMVGNARQFAADGTRQANVEDGLFEVVIVEDVPAIDLMSDTVLERLVGKDSAHIDRFQASSLDIRAHSSDPVVFSVDGEVIEQRELTLAVRPRVLRLVVGEGYDPVPGDA